MSLDINILGDLSNDQPLLALDGTCVEGIALLVQKVMILLLSDERTERFGTGVPQILRNSANIDSGVVSNIFTTALADVKDILDNNTPAGTPNDERLASYTHEVEVLEGSSVSVSITITALSGDTTELKLPIDAQFKENV